MRTQAERRARSSSGLASGHTGRSKSGPSGLAGSAVAAPAATTPGSDAQPLEQRVVVDAALLARAVALHVQEDRRDQHAPRLDSRDRPPAGAGSCAASRLAPASSTTAVATSATTRRVAQRVTAAGSDEAGLRRGQVGGRLGARTAAGGGQPRHERGQQRRAAREGERRPVERRPRAAGERRRRCASTAPARAPPAARQAPRRRATRRAAPSGTAASGGARDAPSAWRSEASGSRSRLRASDSSATFAQASDQHERDRQQQDQQREPHVADECPRATRPSSTLQPSLVRGCSAASAPATPRSSASACARLVPGPRRARPLT